MLFELPAWKEVCHTASGSGERSFRERTRKPRVGEKAALGSGQLPEERDRKN